MIALGMKMGPRVKLMGIIKASIDRNEKIHESFNESSETVLLVSPSTSDQSSNGILNRCNLQPILDSEDSSDSIDVMDVYKCLSPS